MIVSNHFGFSDGNILIYKYQPSLIVKDMIKNIPVMGSIISGFQSLFIKRDKKEDRRRVIKLIEERIEMIKSHDTMPPLMIFPEGTTSNGTALLQFKKGAFMTHAPIKLVLFKLSYTNFVPYFDYIKPWFGVFLM